MGGGLESLEEFLSLGKLPERRKPRGKTRQEGLLVRRYFECVLELKGRSKLRKQGILWKERTENSLRRGDELRKEEEEDGLLSSYQSCERGSF